MTRLATQIDWIRQQHDRMCRLVKQWSSINSHSHHLDGLREMAGALVNEFDVLGGEIRRIDLPPESVITSQGQTQNAPLGHAIHIVKRPRATRRVFLGIHMDTVYPAEHPFQTPRLRDPQTLEGPGVADAKGGLAVMLIALEALEQSGVQDTLGWEVLINPDEELGSPGSSPLLQKMATQNDFGLIFEPTLTDGSLVSTRKGSGNYTAVVRGRAAHAGREFHLGRNAVEAAADLIARLAALNEKYQTQAGSSQQPTVTINVGQVEGGGPVNMVPNLAICRFNIRVSTIEDVALVEADLRNAVAGIHRRDGVSIELHGGMMAMPKTQDQPMKELMEHASQCGADIGLPIQWRSTGGVCDGNRLAAAGLPVLDTMGPQGGDLHSPTEYLLLDSLTHRAMLAALLLMRYADGQWVCSTSRQTV